MAIENIKDVVETLENNDTIENGRVKADDFKAVKRNNELPDLDMDLDNVAGANGSFYP